MPATAASDFTPPDLRSIDIADCTEQAITELCELAVLLGCKFANDTPFESLSAILKAVRTLIDRQNMWTQQPPMPPQTSSKQDDMLEQLRKLMAQGNAQEAAQWYQQKQQDQRLQQFQQQYNQGLQNDVKSGFLGQKTPFKNIV